MTADGVFCRSFNGGMILAYMTYMAVAVLIFMQYEDESLAYVEEEHGNREYQLTQWLSGANAKCT
jgi:hypothetical protein